MQQTLVMNRVLSRLESLPDEIILYILSYLPWKTLLVLATTSKRLNSVIEDNNLVSVDVVAFSFFCFSIFTLKLKTRTNSPCHQYEETVFQ